MPTRVTGTEKALTRFFKAGGEPWWSFGFARVCTCHRAPNIQYASKLIDIQGMLYDGRAYACEIKQKTLYGPLDSSRFAYSQISEEQRAYLHSVANNGGLAMLGLGFVNPKQHPIATFLVPWKVWREVEEKHTRGEEGPAWKSISLEWCRYWVPHYELSVQKSEFYFKEEIKQEKYFHIEDILT